MRAEIKGWVGVSELDQPLNQVVARGGASAALRSEIPRSNPARSQIGRSTLLSRAFLPVPSAKMRMSMCSEKRSISPEAFERLVPPLINARAIQGLPLMGDLTFRRAFLGDLREDAGISQNCSIGHASSSMSRSTR